MTNPNGRFGIHGGQYIPETLMNAVKELEEAYNYYKNDPEFNRELTELLNDYAGRPSRLYYAEKMTKDLGGAKIYLKREDLNHTGAHKINNVLGQALLAKKMGKTRLIAETGAGQHGVATATAAALMGMECVVFMGEEDTKRQALNVYRMRLLGAEVIPVTSGTATLKDAVSEAMREWTRRISDTHYCLGSVMGPHPFPTIVRDFQAIISKEIKEQMLENNEKYLQWFPTSYYAFVQLGAVTLKELAQIKVEDYYYIEPDVTYHALLTGMGDENGTSQCFMDYTFTLPQPTKPAPVVEVKGSDNPNGEESPYEVWFNVKAPNKDVLTAKYVANYDRDMGEMLNMGYTYSMLVDSYGVDFGVEEIDKINSSEGLDMSFSSREDAETVLVVVGSNDEGTGNNPDEENSPAVGRKRTNTQPDAERVESELFTSLAGDWTASATLSRYDSDTREWVPDTEATKFKVSIGAIPSYPETLPEEVYDLYPTMEKEEVDAL